MTDEEDVDFWGHGSPGRPSINGDGDTLSTSDWEDIASARRRLGKEKFSSVTFHECFLVSSPDYVNAVLDSAGSVGGFRGWSLNPSSGSPGIWYTVHHKLPKGPNIADSGDNYVWGRPPERYGKKSRKKQQKHKLG